MDGLGVGLAAIAFWGFVAAVSVAGIWDGIRKREAKHETLRLMMDKEQNLDPDTVDRLIETVDGGGKGAVNDLKAAGYILLGISPGLAILGYFMGSLAESLFTIMLGVSLLVACLAGGLLLAAHKIDDSRKG